LLASWREVGWRKGDHWVDIAGNFTPGGVFSVKGTKEVAYAVFNALTDPENGSNKRVRTGRVGLATDEGSSPRAPPTSTGTRPRPVLAVPTATMMSCTKSGQAGPGVAVVAPESFVREVHLG